MTLQINITEKSKARTIRGAYRSAIKAKSYFCFCEKILKKLTPDEYLLKGRGGCIFVFNKLTMQSEAVIHFRI